MSKENKYDSEIEKELIRILKSYERRASQLDVQEKERIINARQFVNLAKYLVKWLQSRGDEWISVGDRLPDGEVMGANFESGSYGYKEKLIGYISENEQGVIFCENEYELLENCTHYKLIHNNDVITK